MATIRRHLERPAYAEPVGMVLLLNIRNGDQIMPMFIYGNYILAAKRRIRREKKAAQNG
jgi:hypothetical protein